MLGARPVPGIRWCCACAATLCGLAACNEILDIHAPKHEVLDGGPRAADVAYPPDSGLDGGGPDDRPEVWPDWPMPNPSSTGLANAQAYEVDADAGVVVDKVTGLEWQQPIDDELRSFHKAQKYCEELALDGGGLRLPTRIELLSLVDFTQVEPHIDPLAFKGAKSAYFWSSSRFASGRDLAWLVNFGTGPGFLSSSEIDTTYPVRCVRSGAPARVAANAPSGHFVIGDGFVTHTATKLVWQRDLSMDAYEWADAEAYCAGLDLDGKGWRLSTIKELLTLVDETRTSPAIDLRAFPGETGEYIWTSSRVADAKSERWAVSFRFGFDAAFKATTKQHIRCVRSGS